MYLFTIAAAPDAENEEHGEFTHADVSAWINFQEPAGAEELARFYIREAGWTPGDGTRLPLLRRTRCTPGRSARATCS